MTSTVDRKIAETLQGLLPLLECYVHSEDDEESLDRGLAWIAQAKALLKSKSEELSEDNSISRDARPDPEALLRQAVTALNEAPCFRVRRLDCTSYDIAARIDDFFRSKCGSTSPAAVP